MPGINLKRPPFSFVENLLLNMASGLLPENLNKEEIETLEKEYGQNWFEKLGYDSSYKRPSKAS